MRIKLEWLRWASFAGAAICLLLHLFLYEGLVNYKGGFINYSLLFFFGFMLFASIVPLSLRLSAVLQLNRMGYTVEQDNEGRWQGNKPGYGMSGCRTAEELYDHLYWKSLTEAAKT